MNGVSSDTKSVDIYQQANYVTKVAFSKTENLTYTQIGAGGGNSSPSTNSDNVITFTFTSGRTTTTIPATTYGAGSMARTYSWPGSSGTFATLNTSTGVVTANSKGATVSGVTTSPVITKTLKYTWTPKSPYSGNTLTINSTTTGTVQQQANSKSYGDIDITYQTSAISVAGGGGQVYLSNYITGITQEVTYTSGYSAGNENILDSAVCTYTTDVSGWTINGSILTVSANNTSTVKTGTVKFTANHQGKTKTVNLTIRQSARTKTYGPITITNFTYPIAPAGGGSVSPNLSYSQTYGYNGATTGGGTITSGASITYSGTNVDARTGTVTAPSLGANATNGDTLLTTSNVSVIMNGKQQVATIKVYQEENYLMMSSFNSGFFIPMIGDRNGGTCSMTVMTTGTSKMKSGYTIYSGTYVQDYLFFSVNVAWATVQGTGPGNNSFVYYANLGPSRTLNFSFVWHDMSGVEKTQSYTWNQNAGG